jgi:sortase A
MEKKKDRKSGRKFSAFLLIILFAGLALLLYPTISDRWNALHQSRAIASYVETVEGLDEDAYEEILHEAEEYNASLTRSDSRFLPSEEETKLYDSMLDISGSGIMAYVEIPKLDISLPIYHGTDEEVLQTAIGHIQGSSLPVGGEGTHCVISGHRGLPSAKLFTDIDQLAEGDIFIIRVLDETLTYEVDQIHIVEPDDISLLEIEEDMDLCTLVTCTPYGINSHRLLVRGHRIENIDDGTALHISADAGQIDAIIVAACIAVPILLALLLIALLLPANRKR